MNHQPKHHQNSIETTSRHRNYNRAHTAISADSNYELLLCDVGKMLQSQHIKCLEAINPQRKKKYFYDFFFYIAPLDTYFLPA